MNEELSGKIKENLNCNKVSIEIAKKKIVGKGKNKRSSSTKSEHQGDLVKKGKLIVKKARIVKLEVDQLLNNSVHRTMISTVSKKYVGAHVSMAGGIQNAVYNAVKIGGQSFALFLKSQRKWDNPPMDKKSILSFKEACIKFNYDTTKILPHGSYLVNLGSTNQELLDKSRKVFFDDIKRCQDLGIQLYNFHPGSTVGNCTKTDCIAQIGESINMAHELSKDVVCIVENMSGQGYTIGGQFEELRDIINHTKDKSRIGVCLDTCHMFAYGYDISTTQKFDNVMREFDKIVGIKYLRAMHINDSKSELGSKRDLHANIGKGKIGLDAFRFIMNDERFSNIPLILETPVGDENELSIYQKEVDFLYSLVELNGNNKDIA